MINNIIIGTPISGLTLPMLGIQPDENNFTISLDAANEDNLFLPKLLVRAKLFKSTSEIKRITKTRSASKTIKDVDSRELWRTITQPEFTEFKIGKKYFWLLVGSIDK